MHAKAEYKLAAMQPRKTHPMVLVAATGLTIFSILGSAAITGLIPTTHYEKGDVTADKTMILTLPEPGSIQLIAPEPSVQIKNQHGDIQRFNTKNKSKHQQSDRIISDEGNTDNTRTVIV